MIYYSDDTLTIRTLTEADAHAIAAGAVAAERSGLVYLAVGLHKFYGPAQRLYARRGYVPDGSGVWYGDKPCEPYEAYRNDDELNLYLIKNLR